MTRRSHHSTLEPLDTHEVRVVAVLTAGWIVALGLLVVLYDSLPPDQRWWVWTCVAGTIGGLVALAYVYQRRRSMEKRTQKRERQGSLDSGSQL